MQSGYKADAQGRAFQYQFDLQIQRIKIMKSIDIPPNSFMEVIWRRGQNNITTKTKAQVKGHEDDVEFNEKLSMISTCYLNSGSDIKHYNPKQSIVSVIININGSQKLFGSLNINLSQILNPNNHRETCHKVFEEELNGRTKAKISLKLSSTYLKEMVKGDQQSVGSSNNYHNTSSYSIGFGNQNTEKKITDIPSKDAYSMASYGGNIRYSHRRDEQPSSTSLLRKDDSNSKYDEKSITYGYYNTGSSNFYSKTMNEYNLNRNNTNTLSNMNQTITSVSRPSRNSDSENNRSTMGDQNSRLLSEQQNKRSKLEAQNTKAKVENAELKSKLTEYVRENMKLKEQVQRAKLGSNEENTLKRQNQELVNKNSHLAQQIRELKAKFDHYSVIEKQYNNSKLNQQQVDQQLDEKNYMLTKLNQEIQSLQNSLNEARSNESQTLRQLREVQNSNYALENKYKQQLEDVKTTYKRQSANIQASESSLREKDRQIYSQQQQIQRLDMLLNDRDNSCKKIAQELKNKDIQLKELYDHYGSKIKESNNYTAQLQRLKSQIDKLEQEKQKINQESDNKVSRIKQEIENQQRLNQELVMKNNQLISEKNNLLNQIRQDSLSTKRESDKCRDLESRLNEQKLSNQRELSRLNNLVKKMEAQNSDLKRSVNQKSRVIEDMHSNRAESDSLMKQNFQIELQLKYKTQKLQSLEHLEQDYENLAFQKEILEKNYREIQQINEKMEKQLKDKSRALIIESEKNKLINEDKTTMNRSFLDMKDELQRARTTISNGNIQVQEMDHIIYQLQCKNVQLENQLKNVEQNKVNKQELNKYQRQANHLRERVKQLENRNNEKLLTLEKLNKNAALSNNQIKELKLVSEERYQEIVNRDNHIGQLQKKLNDMDRHIIEISDQFNREQQQKKSAIKKVQMLMEQLFVYKKKFQEEKQRSHTSINYRSSDDLLKIKNLENQLQKREERISKLQKEVIALEDENVKLNIEIMKKLEELKVK